MWACWFCGHNLDSNYDTGRSATCASCGRSTRSCRNCHFYTPSAYNACSEPQADRVVDKESANFCDYFKPETGSRPHQKSEVPDFKAAAEALFKKNK